MLKTGNLAVPAQESDIWRVSTEPRDHRRFAWDRGVFEAARRSYTPLVEGTIRSPHHMIMVTLRGGARRHQMKTDCGHRYDGPDRAGCASFLPAHCERTLRIEGVAWEWASIALPTEFVGNGDARARLSGVAPFSNVQDAFLVGLLGEFERIHAIDGALDPAYCDAVSVALMHYLERRYGGRAEERQPIALPPWRLRRIADYVEAHLGDAIRIPELSSLIGLSEGHFHRAFRLTTGCTPLQFINERRIQRAMDMLAKEDLPVSDLALRMGFTSPSHFARVFRAVTGVAPSKYIRDLRRDTRPSRRS